MTKWQEISRDTFPGNTLQRDKWATTYDRSGTPRYYGWGSEWYDGSDPSLVTVSGGATHLKAVRWLDAQGRPKEEQPQKPEDRPMYDSVTTRMLRYRSGMLQSQGSASAPSKGYFQQIPFSAWEAKIKLPANRNAWPAFWVYSTATEIDIVDGVETDGNAEHPGLLNNVINNWYCDEECKNSNPPEPNAARFQNPGSKGACARRFKLWTDPRQSSISTALSDTYHLYTMVWTPDAVSFYFDGREMRTVPRSAVMFARSAEYPATLITLQMNNIKNYDPNETATMDIKYVRILKPIGYNDSDQSTYNLPPSSYKSAFEFINHDVSVTGIPPVTSSRPGIANVNNDAGSIAINPTNSNQVFYR